jgi:hypothetical protein
MVPTSAILIEGRLTSMSRLPLFLWRPQGPIHQIEARGGDAAPGMVHLVRSTQGTSTRQDPLWQNSAYRGRTWVIAADGGRGRMRAVSAGAVRSAAGADTHADTEQRKRV